MGCTIIQRVHRLLNISSCSCTSSLQFRYPIFRIDSKRMASTLWETKSNLKDIFEAGIKAVLPHSVIKNKVKVIEDTFHVGNDKFSLKENVYVVGFGKAVMGMAIVLEEILGDRLKKGIVSIPKGSKDSIWKSANLEHFPKLKGVIEYREGAENNQPDDDSLETTHDILDLVEGLKENDTLIVLISGGGSALLYMPRPLISSDIKQSFCKNLQNAGADITELNTVRKKLSMVKGGGLAKVAYPASVISLIISDIIGDPVNLIASGPTVYSSKSPEEVSSILTKYNFQKTLESDLKTLITSREPRENKDLLDKRKQFKHVTNIIIANNTLAMEAAKLESLKKEFTPVILRNDIKGEVHNVSLAYVRASFYVCLALEKCIERKDFFEKMEKDPFLPLDSKKVDEIFDIIEETSTRGILLIGGGEPTVKVTGSGKGGRNQELALYFSMDWLAKIKSHPDLSKYEVILLSGGTDGQDGPTDAAGAFGYPAIAPIIYHLREKVRKLQNKKKILPENSNTTEVPENLDQISNEIEKLIPEVVLKENNSYNFYSRFKKGEDLVKTGLTGTNVMDLHLILIRKRQCRCPNKFERDKKCADPFDEHDLHSNLVGSERKTNEEITLDKQLELLNIKIVDANFELPCCKKIKFYGDKETVL
ncbi:glycerate kinase isoform X2 [Belonocnema kinseyi]|uniref:glycerate kinase isoform X2 n=1 Tax=Belonocnema kinseyi TaxID=2817044 RepID=UPI00143D39BA|nr:glycerate kinase isoform X2 [Belonocnema kinseyi]